MNNEHDIERSSLLASVSSHKKQNQELLTQKIDLETSLAEISNQLTTRTKNSDKLLSELEGQTASVRAYETRVNELNEQLDVFRCEIEQTTQSNQQLTTQQDAIAQAYQVEKLRNEELESRLSSSEDVLKSVRQLFGQQTANELLSSEVQRVVLENQNLKTSLEQINMDVSLKESSEDELKKELATLRANLDLSESERSKFERNLCAERHKCERELEQQRAEIERQHTAIMENVCFDLSYLESI